MVAAKSTRARAPHQARPAETPFTLAIQGLFREAFPTAGAAVLIVDGFVDYGNAVERDPAFKSRKRPRAAELIADLGRIVAGAVPGFRDAGVQFFTAPGAELVGLIVFPREEV